MAIRTIIGSVLVILAVSSATLAAQQANAREQAREPYSEGLRHMRSEAFERAARAFESATRIDPTFEMAFYQLGRAQMALRLYTSAVHALDQARDLYRAQQSDQFLNKQEGQRLRRERLAELDQLIEDTRTAASLPQNRTRRFSMLEQARQYEERKRQIQDIDREMMMTPSKLVPAFVSLSLGSAYFRANNLAEAEKAYLDAIAADPKVGEAHNNLAVVYMETGRLDEAEKAVKAAEKAGLKVSPALKAEINKRKSS